MPRIGVRSLVAAALVVVTLGAAGGVFVYLRRVPTDVLPPPDYTTDAAWLCRPGRDDACAKPTTATIFEANGTKRIETYRSDPKAPIDCFYVYPTVSRARAAYAPIAVTADEMEVARNQFARFATVCRPFVPLYRQVTRKGLPDLFAGRRGVTIDVPYADVLAAWRAYLANDNGGRPVVLIGHSQGARLLARLVAREIDGKPPASLLLSAIVPGTWIDVPDGKRVGGTFHHIPLCASATQTGCVIAYSSYPADRPMPADARFGATSAPGMRDACVDPAGLAGVAHLDSDFPLVPALKAEFGTDFAEVSGLVSATCKSDGPFHVLAISTNPHDAAGERAKTFMDHIAAENPAFGLHTLDVNLALGTLVDLVRRQAASYTHR